MLRTPPFAALPRGRLRAKQEAPAHNSNICKNLDARSRVAVGAHCRHLKSLLVCREKYVTERHAYQPNSIFSRKRHELCILLFFLLQISEINVFRAKYSRRRSRSQAIDNDIACKIKLGRAKETAYNPPSKTADWQGWDQNSTFFKGLLVELDNLIN